MVPTLERSWAHPDYTGFGAGGGIDAFFPILRGVVPPEEAMDPANARRSMTAAVEQVFRLI